MGENTIIWLIGGFIVVIIVAQVAYLLAGGDFCDLYKYATIKDVPFQCLKEGLSK